MIDYRVPMEAILACLMLLCTYWRAQEREAGMAVINALTACMWVCAATVAYFQPLKH